MKMINNLYLTASIIFGLILMSNNALEADSKINFLAGDIRIDSVYSPTDTVVHLPIIAEAGSFVMAGFQANIIFDQNHLSVSSIDLGTFSAFESDLLSNDILTFNAEPGTIKIAWNGSQSLTAGDTLGILHLYVKPDTPVYTPVSVSFDNTESLIVLNDSGNVESISFVDGVINPVARIDGNIVYRDSISPVDKTKLNFTHTDTSYIDSVDQDGKYSGLLLKETMDVSAERSLFEDDRAAISVADIVKLHRSIVGLDDPFTGADYFIADVNKNDEITVEDGYYLDRFVLGELDFLPAGAWQIIPSEEVSVLPSEPNLTHNISASGDTSEVNFTALLYGDINQSWIDLAAQSKLKPQIAKKENIPEDKISVDKYNESVSVQLELNTVGDSIEIELWSNATDTLAGFQLPFVYDNQSIELVNVISDFNGVDFSVHQMDDDKSKATLLWYDIQNPIRNKNNDVKLATLFFTIDESFTSPVNIEVGKYREWVNSYGDPIKATIWFLEKITTSINEDRNGIPLRFSLTQNYPNPFNPTTIIMYGLPSSSLVELEVFNIAGQKVSTLVNERKSTGWYEVTFDASNLSSGIYIYRLQAGDFVETKKLTLIK
ncbi:MAG: T9SS type A sorting domain-containing protein [Gracilimonas sp.]